MMGGGGVGEGLAGEGGRSLSLPNLSRLSNVFKGKRRELAPSAADRKQIDLNGEGMWGGERGR